MVTVVSESGEKHTVEVGLVYNGWTILSITENLPPPDCSISLEKFQSSFGSHSFTCKRGGRRILVSNSQNQGALLFCMDIMALQFDICPEELELLANKKSQVL